MTDRESINPALGLGPGLRRHEDLSGAAVDHLRFRQLLELARDSDIGDDKRRSLLDDALGQWRGTPLDGLAGEWVDRVRHQFEQQRINAHR